MGKITSCISWKTRNDSRKSEALCVSGNMSVLYARGPSRIGSIVLTGRPQIDSFVSQSDTDIDMNSIAFIAIAWKNVDLSSLRRLLMGHSLRS